MEFVCEAVQRSVRYGTRHGFLVKHKNNYSMSNRNYEADGPEEEEENATEDLHDFIIRQAEANAMEHVQQCYIRTDACFTGEVQCSAKNLLTFERCDRVAAKNNSICLAHKFIENWFSYKKQFIKYFRLPALTNEFMQDTVMNTRILDRDYFLSMGWLTVEDLERAENDFIVYTHKYAAYILNKQCSETVHDLIVNILSKTNYNLQPATGCLGMDLTTGAKCANTPIDSQDVTACPYHYYP